MHILIAPNAFKNSLIAQDAAKAIEEGLLQSKLDCTCTCFPIGDGGDGTGELIIQMCNGKLIEAEVNDPLGRKIKTSFGLIDDGNTAVIEMANASGLRLLKQEELNPLQASSFGTGQLMKTALDMGVSKIIIPMGGSATVDGGAGILKALGVRFLDKSGNVLSAKPDSMAHLEKIDLSGLDKRILNTEVVVLCDVDNTLLGPLGAAAVFGPQKGATRDDVKKLDGALTTFNKVVLRQTGIDMNALKYGGTAGGASAGLFALINAKLENGIEYFLQITGFDRALQQSDIVITGEGSIDEQTLQGKGPFGVAQKAKNKAVKVIGLAGIVPADNNPKLQAYFDMLLTINKEKADLATALKNTANNLTRTATEVGNMLALTKDNGKN